MLSIVMLCVVMLCAVMLCVIVVMPSIIMLFVFMLSNIIIMLCAIMLCVIVVMLSITMLCVVVLFAVMLKVIWPQTQTAKATTKNNILSTEFSDQVMILIFALLGRFHSGKRQRCIRVPFRLVTLCYLIAGLALRL
jgi:hypothetical protein